MNPILKQVARLYIGFTIRLLKTKGGQTTKYFPGERKHELKLLRKGLAISILKIFIQLEPRNTSPRMYILDNFANVFSKKCVKNILCLVFDIAEK